MNKKNTILWSWSSKTLITMNGSLQARGNVSRLYFGRKEGGRGLISCEESVNVEEQSSDKCLSESEEWMLKFVAGKRDCHKWKMQIHLKSV